MEEVIQKRSKNPFKSCFVKVNFKDFTDDIVEVYELVDEVEHGPSKDPKDFIIKKVPVLKDSYSHRKVIHERSKGQDLKSVLARVEKTGDVSLLNRRDPNYGDAYEIPQTLGDACEKAAEGANFLDSLSLEEKSLYMKLAKNPSLIESYVKDIVEKQLNKSKKPVEDKPTVKLVEKGEVENG